MEEEETEAQDTHEENRVDTILNDVFQVRWLG